MCLAASVLYRSELWWQSRQHVGLAIDARNSQGWRHSRPGPHRRWERPMVQSLGIDWMNMALDTAAWNAVAETFVQRCHRNWGIKRMETEHGLAPTTTPAAAPEKKRARRVDAMQLWPRQPGLSQGKHVQVRGDNIAVIRWLEGRWVPRGLVILAALSRAHAAIYCLLRRHWRARRHVPAHRQGAQR